jgi:two-component system NtrC family sensor kinase
VTARATILVVDDSLTVRMDLVEAFSDAGLEVIPCGTAQEARDAFSSRRIDLVVLDVLLPDGDGIELLRELRTGATGPTPPVLVLSTEAEVKDRIRGLQTGADEFVGKPYDRTYIVAKARELLKARQVPGQRPRPTILVIDDSLTFREELRAALVAAGHDVTTAPSGEEGLRLAAAIRPTAILVDGVLPGIDGATVVRRLRLDAALRRTPCLLLTGSEGKGAELRALDAGADGFVRKEEEMGVILARIAGLLRGSSATDEEPTTSVLAPQRILAVDDSVTYLEEVASVLRQEGYDVVLAHSGEEALALLAVQPVDCVLLDVMMPGLSGQETCRRIKAAPGIRDTPLILLTALDNRQVMIDGLATGADDYISKSSDFDVLKARIAAQLRRRQFEDETRRMRAALYQRELEATEARAAREIAENRAVLVAELEQANKELEAFSYSVSHDLRGPLRAVNGFAHILLQDHAPALSASAQELIQSVIQGADRMDQLIEDLLRFARLSRQPLSKRPVDMAGLVQEILGEMSRETSGRAVDLLVGDLPSAVADRALLKLVLTNLLSNAFKFTRARGRPVIEVGSRLEEGEVAYFVRDNGAGFDMRYAGRLFGVFQRLHSPEEFEGTGVGLSLAHRIVQRHGGRIRAEAAVDKGATFSFTLPAPVPVT